MHGAEITQLAAIEDLQRAAEEYQLRAKAELRPARKGGRREITAGSDRGSPASQESQERGETDADYLPVGAQDGGSSRMSLSERCKV
jgi:hypothetical protein